jgi:hypothetical protein
MLSSLAVPLCCGLVGMTVALPRENRVKQPEILARFMSFCQYMIMGLPGRYPHIFGSNLRKFRIFHKFYGHPKMKITPSRGGGVRRIGESRIERGLRS